MKEKYNLLGVDGNAFAIMGYVTRAMKSERLSQNEIKAYIKDATSSDYTHLIIESMDVCKELNSIQL